MRKPKLYYGWYITIALAITETISWGIIYYAFSVFITPMENELGWSRSELTGGFSLALLVAGAMAFPVGTWIDRHGPRLLMTVGSILASLLIVAWSQVSDKTTFYLIWAGLGVCAAAVLYEPAFAVVAAWFVRHRAKALATITFAAGLASTIFIPLSDALLNSVGWRDAVLILGIFLAVTTIPLHAVMMRRRPDDLGLMPDGDDQSVINARPRMRGLSLHSAVHSRFFWLLTLAFSLAALAMTGVRVHFIPFLIDSGIDSSTAAIASGSIGIMQVAGRIIFAPLESRLSIRVMVSGVFALQAAAMFTLLFGPSLWVVGIFTAVFGATSGAQTLARASIIAEIFGPSYFGRISSVMSVFLTLAGTAAPFGAGLIYDHFGSYEPMLWLAVVFALGAVGVMVFAKPDADVTVEVEGTVSPVQP
ncbi:MAG: MFS transporter [Burkholderiales bacterium]|nr:MFS transporter [Anaerolineae bacterium]